MARKPTYEELERKVKELEKVADECMRTDKVFQASDPDKEAILNSLMEHVIHQDTEMRILWANRAACESVNLTYEELFGRHCYEVWPQRSDPCPDCPVMKAMETGQPQEIEKTTPDGKCWFIQGYPLRDSNGNIKGGIEVTLEVTERKRAQDALKESEEKYREFVEGTDDFIAQVDRQGRLTYLNDKAEKVFGLSKAKCIGLYAFDFIHPDDQERTKVAFGEWIRNRISNTTFENRQINQTTGEVCHMHWTINFHYDEDGNITNINSIARDITEHIKTEEALRESEERYRNLFACCPLGIFIYELEHDESLIFQNGNQGADNILGFSCQQFVGKRIEEAFPPLADTEILTRYKEAAAEGKIWETEQIDYSHNEIAGAFKVVAFQTKPNEMACIVEDITIRKQVEEALRESEERLRAIFEQAAVGVAQIESKTGRFIKINQKYCDIVGYTQEEMTAKTFIRITHQDDLQTDLNNMEKLKAGEIREFTMEKRYICKDGSIVWVNLTVSPMWDIDEEPNHHIAVVEDITEKKLLEAHLIQTHKMEAIGTLAGGIAHDFNNILGIILGNTELAMDDVPEWNPVKYNLEEIRTASLRAKDVVRQLLSFARKTQLEKKPTNIIPIIKESLKLMRSSIPTSIEIRQDIPKDVDTILADPTQIGQVLINLSTNADHAMPDGGIIEVTLKNVELDEDAAAQYPELNPGRYVNLTISDTGHGISQEEIDRIFDPYFTTKEVGKGTGIGLAVVHGIVKGHNGLITVETELGKGTTFSIFFPVVEKEAVVETETDEKLPTGDERILFIDDEESIVKIGRQRLERLGYKVEATTSPIEALDLFRSKSDQYDLVITDLTMPQMTGDKLVKEILNMRPGIPIILCTGFSEKIDEKKAKEIGAADYIEKPLDKRNFAFKVRKVLDEK